MHHVTKINCVTDRSAVPSGSAHSPTMEAPDPTTVNGTEKPTWR